MFLRKSSLNQGIHANTIGKVNRMVACFVVDFLAMHPLFDLYIYHNANVSPAPWGGKYLSTVKENSFSNKSEREMLQENQTVLIKFCLKQRKDIAWKFYGNLKTKEIGWPVRKNICYARQLLNGGISSCKNFSESYKVEKPV